MPVLIGTSGWQYADWRGRFYPRRMPHPQWLGHYAEHFRTVEVNNACNSAQSVTFPPKGRASNLRSVLFCHLS